MRDFVFEITETLLPSEVIDKTFIPLVKEKSRDYLFAQLMPYGGKISSFSRVVRSSMRALLADSETIEEHDIQSDLGEINREEHTYELFIGSKCIESFKYRVLFLRFGNAGYPARVVIDEKIANQIESQFEMINSYTYNINKMDEMKSLMNKIADTKALFDTMQEAITATARAMLLKEQSESKDEFPQN